MIYVANNLWRGPRPKDLKDLQALGFQRIISLESGVYEVFHQDTLETEEQHPADYGLESFYIPMNDLFAPEKDQVTYALWLIMGEPPTNKKTYLHCLTGVDRTGYVCAVYRMKVQKWTYESAYAEWVNLGRHWWYDWWKYWMRKYEAQPLGRY
jgi:protein-tyrosine phosphatase